MRRHLVNNAAGIAVHTCEAMSNRALLAFLAPQLAVGLRRRYNTPLSCARRHFADSGRQLGRALAVTKA